MNCDKQINTRLPEDLYINLKKEAEQTDRSMGYLIRKFVEKGLKKIAATRKPDQKFSAN